MACDAAGAQSLKVNSDTRSRIRGTRAEIERCKSKGMNTEALEFLLGLLEKRLRENPEPEPPPVEAPPDWQETQKDDGEWEVIF